MSDLISRQAAIDALDEIEAEVADGYGYQYAKWREYFVEMPPAQPEQRWIPCSERMPYAEYGESDTVLATCGYRNVEDTSIRWARLLYINGGNWCYPTGETCKAKVYAWMPLPEPYKGETAADMRGEKENENNIQ